ncbi:MAG TPA: Dyp-type peroxidase [Solirubrobacteraceae bacterium]
MTSLDRRSFLARSAALTGAAGAAFATGARAADTPAAPAGAPTTPGAAVEGVNLATVQPFSGVHQSGILNRAPANATLLAFDSVAADGRTLMAALQALSARARDLAVGGPVPLLEADAPPADSGILGPDNAPDALTVTIGFGASLFDGRYGLAARRPAELTAMPTFPVDQLDPKLSHGDLLVQICAQHRDTVVHAVRELTRTVRGALAQRWSMDGFSGAGRGPSPKNSPRNLFAFRDGTANPDTSDASLMNQLVWAGAGEPTWAVGGSYQMVRIIRMHVEFWDRVGLTEQQNMIGRARGTGAPLGGTTEFEDPRYDLDPHGKRIPLNAHIRLANPRSAATATQRILRRGFNYHRGFDDAGQLDQGLLFVAYNRSPSTQFAVIQNRLNAEPMTDYVTPIGGGYFFVPPGARSASDFVGSGLFT